MNSKNQTETIVSDSNCARSGPFSNVLCFFDRAASTLIVIGIVILAIAIIYVVIVKTKCYKVFSKIKKEIEMSNVSTSGSDMK